MFRDRIRGHITDAIRQARRSGALPDFAVPEFSVSAPEDPAHGDYATNAALLIAQLAQRPPLDIAEAVADKLNAQRANLIEHVEIAAPGFVNIRLADGAIREALSGILAEPDQWGRSDVGKGKTVVVEYSSPNIAKPLGVHHLRSTIIGQAIINLLRAADYHAVSLSFPGDWGTQFGLLIAGYKRWGEPEQVKQHPIDEMLDLYVRFSQAAKEDPKLLDEGREEFRKLEEGDPENRKLWQWFLDESFRDFNRVYEFLGVNIEHTIGESHYEPELKGIIEDALGRGIARRGEDGAVVIQIPGSSTPEIIQKSDGATIYTTRELAAIRHRITQWNADQLLYVAANQQTFHLEQVFRSAELLGYAKPGQLVHVKFGMMLGPGGKKFATREGNLIPLIGVLQEAIQRSRAIVEQLNPDLPEAKKDEIAKAVGVGAVKYYDLSHHRFSDIVFEWDRMLNLEGASAPYLQYTHARLKSILRKAAKEANVSNAAKVPAGAALDAVEHRLLAATLRLPEAIVDALKDYTPNTLANYLYGLAQQANEFYHSHPVIQEPDEAKRQTRIALVSGVALTLKKGLGLLGIEAPEEM